MRAGYPLVLDRRALLMDPGHQEQRAEEEGWVPGTTPGEGTSLPSLLVSLSQPLEDYGINTKRAQQSEDLGSRSESGLQPTRWPPMNPACWYSRPVESPSALYQSYSV